MEKVKLKDICRLINGRAYKREELLDTGKYPVLRVGNFFSDKDFYYSDLELEDEKYCNNGDLLFAWSASFGPKIWTGEKVIYHYHIWKMELTAEVNKEYLFYYLLHLSERIKSEGHGGIMIHTTKAEMEEREFLLPEMEEQIAISKILVKAETAINKRKEELTVLDELIRARFVEMFGDPVTNPKDLSVVTLGELSELITKGASPSWQGFSYTEDSSQTLFVTSENVREGYMDLTSPKYIEDGFNEKQKRSVIHKGDFLINIVGASIGRAAQFDLDCKANMNQAAALIRVNDERIRDKYLLSYLNSDRAQIMYNSMKSDTGRANLSLQDIAELSILLPPVEMQNQFATFVNQVNKSKIAVEKYLKYKPNFVSIIISFHLSQSENKMAKDNRC